MSETTYRRGNSEKSLFERTRDNQAQYSPSIFMNPQSATQEVVPVASGKAAALSSYLAQGGTPFKASGRYKTGPMKGMNTDQATAQFERMWASAPDSIKEKYASRAQKTDMAPSERNAAMAGVTTPAPKPKTTARPAYDKDGNGIPDIVQRPAEKAATPAQQPAMAPTGSTFKELTTPSPVPAGGIKSVGDGSTAKNGWTPQPRQGVLSAMGEDARTVAGGVANIGKAAASDITSAATTVPQAIQDNLPGKTGTALRAADPVGAVRGVVTKVLGGPAAAVGSLAGQQSDTPSTTVSGSFNPALEKAFPGIQWAVPAQTSSGVNPALEKAFPGIQAQAAESTPAPPIAPTPIAPKQPAAPAQPPAPGVKSTTTPSRINSLTGLPIGYRPGDSTAGMDQFKVAESNSRAMDSAVAAAKRPMIVGTPSPSARYADAQAAYQSSGLDPAKAREMDAVYSGASSLDQAKIIAQSLKRAAPLAQRDSAMAVAARKPMVGNPSRPMFARR